MQAAVSVGSLIEMAAGRSGVSADDVAGWQDGVVGGRIPFKTVLTATMLGLIGRWTTTQTVQPSAPPASLEHAPDPDAPPPSSSPPAVASALNHDP